MPKARAEAAVLVTTLFGIRAGDAFVASRYDGWKCSATETLMVERLKESPCSQRNWFFLQEQFRRLYPRVGVEPSLHHVIAQEVC